MVVTWKSTFLDQSKTQFITATAGDLVERLCPRLAINLVGNGGAEYLDPILRASSAEQSDEDWQKGLAFPSS